MRHLTGTLRPRVPRIGFQDANLWSTTNTRPARLRSLTHLPLDTLRWAPPAGWCSTRLPLRTLPVRLHYFRRSQEAWRRPGGNYSDRITSQTPRPACRLPRPVAGDRLDHYLLTLQGTRTRLQAPQGFLPVLMRRCCRGHHQQSMRAFHASRLDNRAPLQSIRMGATV